MNARMRRIGLGLLPLAAALPCIAPARAATAGPAPAAAADPAALKVLLDQAHFWQLQNQPARALEALRRALLLDPSNTDALGLAAQIEAGRGDRTAAIRDLARLRALRPTDPRIVQVEQALRVGPIDQAGLAQARALAAKGQVEPAIEAYRALFHGNPPPPELAVEYYQLLAGTKTDWQAGQEGLARIVAADPRDVRAQLAYATVLTYQPSTRADGISRLAILARNPSAGEAARTAWRQALDWLPVDQGSIPLYQAYLDVHPDDAALARKLADAKNPPRTPADIAGADRVRGFDALQAGRLADAAAAFQAALAIDANDADATGGLGLVRLREGKSAEARQLLEKAIALSPEHADRWQAALAGAASATEMASARQLIASGQLAAAETQLRAIIARGGDVTGAQQMLADVQTRRGDLAGAEASYRAVLARQPGNVAAMVALAGVLQRRGKSAEAQTLLARAEASGGGRLAGQARASQLRLQAEQTNDPAARIALLQAASAAAPQDPWTKFDLARALRANGQAAEARALMQAAVAASPTPETLHAAALFAMQDGQPAEAAALAARIPPGRRPADVTRILAEAKFRTQVDSIMAGAAGNPMLARQRLLTLAAAPDPGGSRGAAIAHALAAAGDKAGARLAIDTALAANPNAPAGARIAYAGALLEAGQGPAANALLVSLAGAPGLTAQQRSEIASLQDGIAVQTSDRLNAAGHTAQAYDALAPALARSPENPGVNMALARLYSTADDPKQALAINEAILRRDPGNLDARRGAVAAAIRLGRLQEADTLAQEGLSLNQGDPRAWLAAADVARARGDSRTALRDLRTARDLEQQNAAAPALASAAGAPPVPVNPFRQGPPPESGAGAAANPLTADIDRQIREVREQLATWVQLGPGFRARSGSPGLDQLSEMTVPLMASLSPGGYGRLTFTATPVLLQGGTLYDTPTSLAQFGTNALGGAVAPGDQNAQGVALELAYAYGWLKADVGSTPIGFRTQNIVGGVELSPEIAPGLRLRVAGERRAVTDSLLSYASTVDPRTGEVFGGVVRTRGHLQLELTRGLANFYIGGGGSALSGRNVASNTSWEFGAGGSYPVWRAKGEEVRAGLDLVYFGYDKNLRYFSLGQGGYFSPQNYFAALIPVSYTSTGENLTWTVGATLGIQSYNESASNVFPNDPGLQQALVAESYTNAAVVTQYPSDSKTGFTGGAHGSFDYRIDTGLHIGGTLRYDRAGDWNEVKGLLYARYVFNPGS